MTELPLLACKLPSGEQAERGREFERLRAVALGRETTAWGARLRLTGGEDVERAVEDLAARERACCPVLDIRVERRSGEIWLEIHAPPELREATARLLVG
ncbi:MAG: hypothetical protein ACRDM9_09875 [Gaiellaceae bacterium]